MSKLSCSFTLGKASAGNANIEHNNREFISSNVDVSRIANNIIYVREDIRAVYDELFSESLAEYNAKQKRNDRKIHDYFQHIQDDKRKETHYEIIVQFGDANTAGIGSETGEVAKKMLDEYMQGFETRNPNLRVFNSTLHADEASYHIHIDFVPFYTQGREKGLSKGVSMRSALEEQGFTSNNRKMNSLVAWENSEMVVMKSILNEHGLDRDVKNAKHAHRSVPQYKENQDWRKLPKWKRRTQEELAADNVNKLEQDISLLKIENEKLQTERNSDWKCFYFSDPDKQTFVQSKLAELSSPVRETDTGFEAQACHVERIRQIEKQYKSNPTSHRDVLRNRLDKIIMQASDYDKIFEGLKFYGYEIKHAKYTAVKPKDGTQFICLKSLGEMYNEQALHNRVENRNIYEANTIKNVNAVEDKNSLECMGKYAIYQYVIVFKSSKLPAKKLYPKLPFTFKNDAELDRLASLNKKINEGVTIESLRGDLARSERDISNMEKRIDELKNNLGLDKNLYEVAERWYTSTPAQRNRGDLEILERYEYTSEKYYHQKSVIAENEKKIANIEKSISDERTKIKDTSETLAAFERIASATYVDSLAHAEREKRLAKKAGNGLKSANLSLAESVKVDEKAEKVMEVIAKKEDEPVVQNYNRPKTR